MDTNVQIVESAASVQPNPQAGTAGLKTQSNGQPTTVSAAAQATGGIDGGNFVEPDIDEELFKFNSDETPLMGAMLQAKKVKVASPMVDHYMIDEPRSFVTTSTELAKQTGTQAILPIDAEDQTLPQDCGTLLVKGVDGYDEAGQKTTPGKDLMLYVVGTDTASGNPIVVAANGYKTNSSDEVSKVPAIPAGSKVVILGNAMSETQKDVPPTLITPEPYRVYLQKRGMNQIVSDYFDAQKKRIPFTKALIAEAAIKKFKVEGNRTLWAGIKGKVKVKRDKVGMQDVYFTEGVRWQFKKELTHEGNWAIDQFIALAKMFYTGEDVPQNGILFAGKNLVESIQKIDYSKHPEIQIQVATNPIGWAVTRIHTVFGDIDIKHDPTLDRLGWSNSGALIGLDRLVHYEYSAEKSFSEDIEGEEAKRDGILVWDALALKGSCHVWINGEGEEATSDSTNIKFWDNADAAPTTTAGTKSAVYYLSVDCSAISATAKAGEMWQYDGSAWHEFSGEVYSE